MFISTVNILTSIFTVNFVAFDFSTELWDAIFCINGKCFWRAILTRLWFYVKIRSMGLMYMFRLFPELPYEQLEIKSNLDLFIPSLDKTPTTS